MTQNISTGSYDYISKLQGLNCDVICTQETKKKFESNQRYTAINKIEANQNQRGLCIFYDNKFRGQ